MKIVYTVPTRSGPLERIVRRRRDALTLKRELNAKWRGDVEIAEP